MKDLPYLLTAVCAGVIAAYKFQALLRAPREARRTIRPVCFGGLCVCVQFFFVAPSVSGYVNDVSGVPNLSRLIVYTFGIGLVCSAQVLVLNWRFDQRHAQRVVRWVLAGSVVVVALMCALFWLGSAHEERLDFPGSFARVPYLAAFLVIYFSCYAVGVSNSLYQGWRGARDVPESKIWLRRAVRMTVIGMSFPVAYAVLSLVAVVAVWFGKDQSYLAVVVAPALTMLGVPWFLMAITIALWGPRIATVHRWLSEWRSNVHDYVALGPLWRALRSVNPDVTHSPQRLSEWLSIEFRLFWRVLEINDWLEQLYRLDAPVVDDLVTRYASARGLPVQQVAAAIKAAQKPSPAPENKFVFAEERARLVSMARALDVAGRT